MCTVVRGEGREGHFGTVIKELVPLSTVAFSSFVVSFKTFCLSYFCLFPISFLFFLFVCCVSFKCFLGIRFFFFF